MIPSGQNPQYPNNHVNVWDDQQNKVVGHINQF